MPKVTLILLLFVPCSGVAVRQAQAQAHPFQQVFAPEMKSGVACYRIPVLLTAANGDLLAVADERVANCSDLRSNEDINLVLRRSKDGGETWSEQVTLIDYPLGESASDPSMILDEETGEIFLFYNYMNLRTGPGRYQFKLVKSTDHGQSWSAPMDVTAQIAPDAWEKDFKFMTSGKGIQTREGLLLHTLVHLEHGAFVFGSADHGQHWFLIDTPLSPGDESKVVELPDGRWMVNSRVNGAGLRYVHVSSDRGKTWVSRPDSALIDPGVNASLIRATTAAGSDVLLFSNPKTTETRERLFVRISEDGGQSWNEGQQVYPGKAAYSSLSVLADGSIGLLFEKDGYQEIVFVRVRLDWFTATGAKEK